MNKKRRVEEIDFFEADTDVEPIWYGQLPTPREIEQLHDSLVRAKLIPCDVTIGLHIDGTIDVLDVRDGQFYPLIYSLLH